MRWSHKHAKHVKSWKRLSHKHAKRLCARAERDYYHISMQNMLRTERDEIIT